MATYVVSYDLLAPGRDYEKLFSYLKSHTRWAHPLESTWVVVSSLSAAGLRDGRSRAMSTRMTKCWW